MIEVRARFANRGAFDRWSLRIHEWYWDDNVDGVKELVAPPFDNPFLIHFHRIGFRLTVSPSPLSPSFLSPSTFSSRSFGVRVSPSPFSRPPSSRLVSSLSVLRLGSIRFAFDCRIVTAHRLHLHLLLVLLCSGYVHFLFSLHRLVEK